MPCLEEDNISARVSCYEDAIKHSEEDCISFIHMLIGEAYYNCKYYEEALDEYSIMLEHAKSDHIRHGGYAFRADAYRRLCMYNEAVSDYNHAIEMDEDRPDSYTGRGIAYLYLEDIDAALNDFHTANELEPNNGQNLFNIGQTYTLLKDEENAKRYLKEGVLTFEGSEDLGDMYHEFLASNTVVEMLEEKRGFPSYSNIKKFASSKFDKEEYDTAVAYYLVSYFYDPYDSTTAYNIALGFEKLEKLKLSVSYYNIYLCLEPEAEDREEVESTIDDLVHSTCFCHID